MAEEKKQMVKVEYDFLLEIQDFISCLDLSNYDLSIQTMSENILYEIELKNKKLNARKEFSKIKYAKAGEEKENAIIDYLKAKNEINL